MSRPPTYSSPRRVCHICGGITYYVRGGGCVKCVQETKRHPAQILPYRKKFPLTEDEIHEVMKGVNYHAAYGDPVTPIAVRD